MNEAEYRQAEGIRRSDLWVINDSPEKFRYKMDNPSEESQAPALVFGAAAHKILLEPTDFFEEYAIAPEGIDRRTKDGKAAWVAFTEAEAGKTILDRETYDTVKAMANKVLADPMARKLFAGRKELPYFWTDPDTGVKCKVKLDCLTYLDDMPVVVDYKTCKSARTEAFQRDAVNYGYYLQAAMYTEGLMRCGKLTERPMFVFVVQEKTPGYSMNIITVSEDAMNYGIDIFRTLIGIYADCEKTGNWWGYNGKGGQPNELLLPAWLKKTDSQPMEAVSEYEN